MAIYKKSIFTVLKNLQKVIIDKSTDTDFVNVTKSYFYFMDKFIRSGALVNTEQSNYILKYYDYPDSVLVQNYKRLYGEDLAESTVKTIKYRANLKFESLIDSAVNVETAFYSKNEEYLINIVNKVKCFESVDLTVDDILCNDVIKSIVGSSVACEEFELEDCINELEFIFKLSKKNIEKYIKNLNIDKLNYILRVLGQPLLKINNGINEQKQKLLLMFNSDITKDTFFESVVSAKEYITQKTVVNKERNNIDYKEKYEQLLEEYTELKNGVAQKNDLFQYRKWNDFEMTDLYMSSVFNGEVVLPKALLSLVADISLEQEPITKFENITLLELQKALLVLAKHSTPCILNELESLDPKVLSFIWSAMNNNEHVKQYESAILSSITHFIDDLSNSDYEYSKRDMSLMLEVKDKASSVRNNKERID